MSLLLSLIFACGAPAAPPAPADAPDQEALPMPRSLSPAEQHARNLRFRDNRSLFNESARWLDTHRDEALEVMARLLVHEDPAAIGIARVFGVMAEPRAVPALEAALAASDDALAFEAARALARIPEEAAANALRRAAQDPSAQVVKNALRGIALRGDEGLCDAVRPHLGAGEPVGTQARRAAEALGCG